MKFGQRLGMILFDLFWTPIVLIFILIATLIFGNKKDFSKWTW